MLGLPRQAMSLKYVALSRRRVVSIGPYGCQVNAPFFPKHVFCCRKFIGRISPPGVTEKASAMMAVAAPNLPPVPLAVRSGCTGNVVANVVANFAARFAGSCTDSFTKPFYSPVGRGRHLGVYAARGHNAATPRRASNYICRAAKSARRAKRPPRA